MRIFLESDKALGGLPQFLSRAQSLRWRQLEVATQKWKLKGFISSVSLALAAVHSMGDGFPSACLPHVIYRQYILLYFGLILAFIINHKKHHYFTYHLERKKMLPCTMTYCKMHLNIRHVKKKMHPKKIFKKIK